MGKNLFSGDLELYNSSLSSEIEGAINEVLKFTGKRKVTVYKWDNNRIAISVKLKVDLPSRGALNVDIRSFEPILIIFDLVNFPEIAPSIKSDRKDFPKDFLPHLYISQKDKPVSLCLVRGSINEWFADKKISDLLLVVEMWLAKAGSGNLAEDGDEFDPQLIEKSTSNAIYSYDKLIETVNNNETILKDKRFALTLFKISKECNEKSSSYKIMLTISEEKILDKVNEIVDRENKRLDKIEKDESWGLGLLVWSDNKNSVDRFSKFPANYGELVEFCRNKLNIEVNEAINYLIEKDLKTHKGVPLIVAVSRNKKLIGFSGAVEFLNFLVFAPYSEFEGNKIPESAEVSMHQHREPLSVKKAQEISNFNNDFGRLIILGSGAIGSKLILHFARSGKLNMTIVDNSSLAPHNLVRHALTNASVNKNKAKAITDEIKEMFLFDNTEPLKHYSKNICLNSKETLDLLNEHDVIIDTTASNNVSNSLIKRENLKPKIIKCEVAFKGKLGFLYKEGEHRNPRIDDLQIEVFRLGQSYPQIANWLNHDNDIVKDDRVNEIINVGIGCHSDTLIMPDDLISLHTSIFSNNLKQLNKSKSTKGKISIVQIDNSSQFNVSTSKIVVKPVTILNPINNSEWQIRLRNGLSDQMIKKSKNAYPDETGGIFIGLANHKTKIIYVTNIVNAPRDSEATPVCFIRGVQNLPETVDKFKENSGQLLGYVGEWHTHPHGPNSLSTTDINTLQKLKRYNDEIPMPTFVIIVSPDDILLPYVF